MHVLSFYLIIACEQESRRTFEDSLDTATEFKYMATDRQHKQGNEKLKAGLREGFWTQSQSSSVVTDKTGSVENARLIEVGILVVDYVDNFCYSGLRMDHLDDNLYPSVALFLVKLHWLNCVFENTVLEYISRLGYWMLTMQGKYSKNDEFGGKGNITAAFFWLGSSLHGQRIK
ncbi:hypothetical protein ACROYT_G038798 [Oculina patagonica]